MLIHVNSRRFMSTHGLLVDQSSAIACIQVSALPNQARANTRIIAATVHCSRFSRQQKNWRQKPWPKSEELAERRMFRRGLQVLTREGAARLSPSELNETN